MPGCAASRGTSVPHGCCIFAERQMMYIHADGRRHSTHRHQIICQVILNNNRWQNALSVRALKVYPDFSSQVSREYPAYFELQVRRTVDGPMHLR